jgi:hypothetical protein
MTWPKVSAIRLLSSISAASYRSARRIFCAILSDLLVCHHAAIKPPRIARPPPMRVCTRADDMALLLWPCLAVSSKAPTHEQFTNRPLPYQLGLPTMALLHAMFMLPVEHHPAVSVAADVAVSLAVRRLLLDNSPGEARPLPCDQALCAPAGYVFCAICVLPSASNSVAAPDPGSGRTYFLLLEGESREQSSRP